MPRPRVYARLDARAPVGPHRAGEQPERSCVDRLESKVRELEDMGVDGLLFSDHLFMGSDDAGGPQGYVEPLTLLAAAGVFSEKMVLGTMVSNFGLEDPVLHCRRFAQLADLYGADRVLVGVGAGWNGEEWRALGRTMPSHEARMGRLEEVLVAARSLFHNGTADCDGHYVKLRGFPFSPWPERPPRLMVGGGSDRLLDIAGRYADVIDLNGSSRRLAVGGARPRNADARRRMTTTVADLEHSVSRARSAAREAGRKDGLQFSVVISKVMLGSNREVAKWAEELAAEVGVSASDVYECPYVVCGSATGAARSLAERVDLLGLEAVIVTEGEGLRSLCQEILPHLATPANPRGLP